MSAPQAVGGRASAWLVKGLGIVAGSVAGAGLAVVIAAGFALSFDAVSVVARASGVRAELAWLLPAAVDGAMAVGAVTAVVVRRLGRPTAYPWAVVLVNAAISVAGNGLHAYAGTSVVLPAGIAVAVSAVPAVNLALSVHLLVMLVDVLADVIARSASATRGGAAPQVPGKREAASSEAPGSDTTKEAGLDVAAIGVHDEALDPVTSLAAELRAPKTYLLRVVRGEHGGVVAGGVVVGVKNPVRLCRTGFGVGGVAGVFTLSR